MGIFLGDVGCVALQHAAAGSSGSFSFGHNFNRMFCGGGLSGKNSPDLHELTRLVLGSSIWKMDSFGDFGYRRKRPRRSKDFVSAFLFGMNPKVPNGKHLSICRGILLYRSSCGDTICPILGSF